MTLSRPILSATAAALLWLNTGHDARADDPSCDSLQNPIYMQVGDTQEPLMKTLGRALRDSTANPLTIVYVTNGSCTNIQALYSSPNVPITTNAKYVPSTSENADWKTSDASLNCTIPSDSGHAVDIANSALFVSACNPGDTPDGIKLFQGPNQGYAFVVPETSQQKAMTAEAAYLTFGFGTDSGTPWDNPDFMFIRTPTKSTLLALAAAIHVPAMKWQGKQENASSDVLNDLKNSTDADKTIGILGTEIYDANRDSVNVLAYRTYQQHYAYYPDSTFTSFDKRNLRDGHYTTWSPTVWMTHVDSDGKPTSDRAEYVISLILETSATPTPDFEPLDSVIKVGLVPACAMHVTRTQEGGDLSLYQADAPCDCYYESHVQNPSSTCATCDDQTPCSSGTCRRGFCEAR
jgi:hypothetical protein